VAEAVEISQIMKAPVKVIWTREEDNRDPYELRCDLLTGSLRLLNVLKLAAKKADWHRKPVLFIQGFCFKNLRSYSHSPMRINNEY
jgi:hypothetical protein